MQDADLDRVGCECALDARQTGCGNGAGRRDVLQEGSAFHRVGPPSLTSSKAVESTAIPRAEMVSNFALRPAAMMLCTRHAIGGEADLTRGFGAQIHAFPAIKRGRCASNRTPKAVRRASWRTELVMCELANRLRSAARLSPLHQPANREERNAAQEKHAEDLVLDVLYVAHHLSRRLAEKVADAEPQTRPCERTDRVQHHVPEFVDAARPDHDRTGNSHPGEESQADDGKRGVVLNEVLRPSNRWREMRPAVEHPAAEPASDREIDDVADHCTGRRQDPQQPEIEVTAMRREPRQHEKYLAFDDRPDERCRIAVALDQLVKMDVNLQGIGRSDGGRGAAGVRCRKDSARG